jgi:hypothetical protein
LALNRSIISNGHTNMRALPPSKGDDASLPNRFIAHSYSMGL